MPIELEIYEIKPKLGWFIFQNYSTNLAYFFISQTPIYRCLVEAIKKAMLNLRKN